MKDALLQDGFSKAYTMYTKEILFQFRSYFLCIFKSLPVLIKKSWSLILS
jgi:hypothetical protein